MGKKNQYSFSKRQREINKKKKADEKRMRKQAKKEGIDPDEYIANPDAFHLGEGEESEPGTEGDDGTPGDADAGAS